jgi:predicted Na+-dependent transporter
VSGMPDGPARGVVAGAVAVAVVLAVGGVLLTPLCLPIPMREGGRAVCMLEITASILQD